MTATSLRDLETGEAEEEYRVNPISLYLREIGGYPLLTPEEERSLAVQMRAGDVAAKERFIASNLKLVVSVARQYVGSDQCVTMTLLDLIQEGNIGLFEAAARFDPDIGRFSTFAVHWIREQMRQAIARQSRTIRFPMHVHKSVGGYARKKMVLEARLKRKPTLSEIAEALEIPIERVVELQLLSVPVLSCGLVEEGDDGPPDPLLLYPDPNPRPEDTLGWNEIIAIVEEALSVHLTKRERCIVMLRYGIGCPDAESAPGDMDDTGNRKLPFSDIATIVGLSMDGARRSHDNALSKIRRALATFGYRRGDLSLGEA
jgi:RNA polymerase primary sigma factor